MLYLRVLRYVLALPADSVSAEVLRRFCGGSAEALEALRTPFLFLRVSAEVSAEAPRRISFPSARMRRQFPGRFCGGSAVNF